MNPNVERKFHRVGRGSFLTFRFLFWHSEWQLVLSYWEQGPKILGPCERSICFIILRSVTWPVTDYMACDRFVLLPSHEAYLSYDLPACYKTSSLVGNMKTVKFIL